MQNSHKLLDLQTSSMLLTKEDGKMLNEIPPERENNEK